MNPIQQSCFTRGSLMKEEDMTIEYKDYQLKVEEFKEYILTVQLRKALKSSVCAFLNSLKQGGVIFLGITDERIVKGVKLDDKQRDTLRRYFNHYIFDGFSPEIELGEEFVKVDYVPVMDENNGEQIEDLCIVRIIVNSDQENKKVWTFKFQENEAWCYVRNPSENVQLVGRKLIDTIYERIEKKSSKRLLDIATPMSFQPRKSSFERQKLDNSNTPPKSQLKNNNKASHFLIVKNYELNSMLELREYIETLIQKQGFKNDDSFQKKSYKFLIFAFQDEKEMVTVYDRLKERDTYEYLRNQFGYKRIDLQIQKVSTKLCFRGKLVPERQNEVKTYFQNEKLKFKNISFANGHIELSFNNQQESLFVLNYLINKTKNIFEYFFQAEKVPGDMITYAAC